MLAIIIQKKNLNENKKNIFIDLDKNHWAYKFIISCAAV
jgi:hypothetical protein